MVVFCFPKNVVYYEILFGFNFFSFSMSKRPNREPAAASFDPSLSQGVIATLLIILACIITLSFFGRAGTLGIVINEWILSFLFGIVRYITPAILIIFAWHLVVHIEFDYRKTHGIGAILFFLSASGLLHMGYTTNDMWLQAVNGHGGGVFGMLAWPLKTYLGAPGSYILLFGIVVISLLFLFNTHPIAIYRKLKEQRQMSLPLKKSTIARVVTDDEEESDEEEDEKPLKQTLFKKSLKSQEPEEDEDVEEEEAAPRKVAPKVIMGSSEVISPLTTPEWQKNVVIKDLPPIELLQNKKDKPTSGDIEANAEIISDTFHQFNIDVEMSEVRVGPSVTQYTLKPAKGVKLSRITGLSNDLALALAAHPIRIEAPIPGKPLVGIEVPNHKAAMVTIREILESVEFHNRKHNMMIALGKDVGGRAWFADLPRMPHLLIAGSTGSGKTVCMNTIILSLLYQNTAEDLRMIMVDPKRVELTLYNGIPHLLTPVITNAAKTVNALKWTIGEMDRRFEILAQAGNRDIGTYNISHPSHKLPYIVFIIDELADLMATAAGDVEAGIIRLAQMARAVGIHLIVATQRPSVDVITGLMKANIPARIAFSVASLMDSRTILDTPGAEKLLGRGDMLFQTAELSKPVRLQGAFVSEEELKKIADHLKGDEEPVYDTTITEKTAAGSGGGSLGGDDGQDALFDEAKSAILEAGKASASFLQRRLKVGYARAARLLDELEAAGIIGPGEGAKPRDILINEVEIEENEFPHGGNLNVYKKTDERIDEEEVEEIEDEITETDEVEDEVFEEDDKKNRE
jgi:S-DNA-T family DNA segregation ATPase FtsK/SpoIIIE